MESDPGARYRPLRPQDISQEQRAVYAEIAAGPRGRVLAPFHLLLQNPVLANHAQHLGAYLRYSTSLPARLSELAILATAKYWDCSYEWEHHLPIALAANLSQAAIEAVETGVQPTMAPSDETLMLELCRTLLRTGLVDDSTFHTARTYLGHRALVETVAILGYYSMLAMLLNAYRVPPDADEMTG